MSPEISVDPQRLVPPYEQIREQISSLIVAGVLTHEDRLPPIRQLASDLGVAPGTVARAYQELEAAGLVETRRGGGTRVLAQPASSTTRRRKLLAERAADFLLAAKGLGATSDEAIAAIQNQLHRVFK